MKISRSWLNVVLLLSLACTWRPANLVAGQESLRILVDSAAMDFPRKIKFTLNAESESAIESVTLRYGTAGRSCGSSGGRQLLEVEPNEQVKLSWEWDLEHSGILPHGVEVWWQWEIRDAEGIEVTTERQTMLVIDDRRPFQQLNREQVTLSWLEGNDAFGQQLLDEVVTNLERLEAEIGVRLEGEVKVVVYPSAEAVQEALVHTTEWTGAVAFSQYNIVVAGIRPGQDEWAASVLPHELAHLVIGAFTFNCAGIWLPTWLSEGLAEFSEGGIEPEEAAVVQTALNEGSLPSLRSLAYGFSASGYGAVLSYEQSRQVVTFLLEEFGSGKMSQLLRLMQDGKIIDDALMSVYGFNTDGLDSAWRVSLGAEPLSTSEWETSQAVPTAVATLPLFTLPTRPMPLPASATPLPTVTITATSRPTATATRVPTLSPKATATAAESKGIVQRSTPEVESAVQAEVDPLDVPAANLAANSLTFIGAGLLLAGLVIGLGAFMTRRAVLSSVSGEEE